MRIFCLSWLLCIIAVAFAQMPKEPAYRIYTIRDGLAQMKVGALLLDHHGLLWIGTRNGLSRYDGENFISFAVGDGLLHDRILALHQHPSGDILILTAAGVQSFDGAEFKSFPFTFPNVKYEMRCMPDSSVWILDCRYGKVWELKNGNYHEMHAFADTRYMSTFLYDSELQSLHVAGQGSLMALWPTKEDVRETNKKTIPLMGDVTHKSVIAQGGNPILFFELVKGTFVPMASFEKQKITDLRPNGFWYYRDNVLHLPASGGLRATISDVFINVEDVILDSDAQFWIGSDNGLGRVYPDLFQHIPYNVLPNVWSMIEDDAGGMWFGTYGNGLYHMPAGDTVPVLVDEHATGGSREYFLGAIRTPDGSLHFAHMQGLVHIPKNAIQPVYDLKRTVFTLRYDTTTNRIVEGVYGGINVMSQDWDLIKYWGVDDGVHANDYIQHIAIDHEGCYWLGSYTGVTKVCHEQGIVTAFSKDAGNLPSQGVFAISEDPYGRLWLGGDEGLMYYDFDEKGIQPLKSHVLQELVKSLLVLDSTYLLIAAKTGLYLLNCRLFNESGVIDLQMLGASSGYSGIEPGFNGLYKDEYGRVWIASAAGTDILFPEKLHHSSSSLSVLITQIDEQPVPFSHDTLFPIKRKKDQVTIYYTAVGMNRPYQTQYQYRLDDDEWSAWSPNTSALLIDLGHGRHTFSVRAGPVDSDPETEYIDSIDFGVELALYQRAFFLPAVIALLCLLLGLVLISTIRQRRAHRLYKSQQQEARYLRSQLLLAELNPHFIFNVLASIQNKVLMNRKQEASDNIVKLSKLMRNFLQATYRSNEQSGSEYEIALSQEIELLSAFIQFEQDKCDRHFEFRIDIDPAINPEQTTIPPMLVQPYAENAIKHGLLPLAHPGGLLEIQFVRQKDDLRCIIRDNGIGREEARRRSVNKFQTHRSLGTSILAERIELLNQLGYRISVMTQDVFPSGTEVRIVIADSLQE